MVPLSKAKRKLFRSLQQKKFRQREGRFLLPGKKLLGEALRAGWPVEWVVATEGTVVAEVPPDRILGTDISTLRELSGQVQPEGIVAVVRIPPEKSYSQISQAAEMPPLTGPAFVLDGVSDPGNLGTLIRTADGMGFEAIIAGPGTADIFNPKVLRSSMGSIFRLRVIYLADLPGWLNAVAERVCIADMGGIPLPEPRFLNRPFIVLGNEANGVSPAIKALPGTLPVSIPGRGGAESLNVAVSGAVLAWEMMRARGE
ncbi:MAG: RNA methyltransferase [Bacteroidota bacterium]